MLGVILYTKNVDKGFIIFTFHCAWDGCFTENEMIELIVRFLKGRGNKGKWMKNTVVELV